MKASDHPGLAFPKGETRARQKKREERQFTKARNLCRREVFKRAGGRCQACGRPLVLRPSRAEHFLQIANVHEEPPRSLGGDPTNPQDCVCVCAQCHEEIRLNLLDVVFVRPDLKARGPVEFQRRLPECRSHARTF